jgi:hypothetical protein
MAKPTVPTAPPAAVAGISSAKRQRADVKKLINNSPYYIGGSKVVTLSATELALLRGFVRDVLETCDADYDGVTWGLEDQAKVAAEILKMIPPPKVDDDE